MKNKPRKFFLLPLFFFLFFLDVSHLSPECPEINMGNRSKLQKKAGHASVRNLVAKIKIKRKLLNSKSRNNQHLSVSINTRGQVPGPIAEERFHSPLISYPFHHFIFCERFFLVKFVVSRLPTHAVCPLCFAILCCPTLPGFHHSHSFRRAPADPHHTL